MPTVLRIRGLRVVIYSNDHRPPHVHVIAPGGHAKVLIEQYRMPIVLYSVGIKHKELEVALEDIDGHTLLLLERWRQIHGDA